MFCLVSLYMENISYLLRLILLQYLNVFLKVIIIDGF